MTTFGTTIPSSNFRMQGTSNNFLLSNNNNNNNSTTNPLIQNPFRSNLSTVTTIGNSPQLTTNLTSAADNTMLKHRNFIMNQDNPKESLLLPNPQSFGFKQLKHTPREMPRFLISQQPQLEQKPYKQDPWDKANQAKMSNLENSIDDLTELYETLKKMRDSERKIMEKKGLVDKADFAKDLNDAIVFQGTCEDMCPIFERARRNVEHTVFSYEKDSPSSKKASATRALKVFARPAAAAAPPLPSDVRPPHILVKSLDYIIDNLLTTLPESEGFIWDRMRSIRQDFTYQNYCGPEAIDCNERIVRIHLLILHVMAKSTVKFSLQQELEQLHKSLITLSEIYDDVRANGGTCPNEAEFRAYSLLSKIRDPQYDKTIQDLPTYIVQDELVQLAICFRRILSNSNYLERGYIKTENGINLYTRFFTLMRSERVPFLMNSFLQMYLGEVRFYAMKALSLTLNKRHKPIPLDYLQNILMFNDKEELLEFCSYYSITVVESGLELRSLTHHSHKLREKKPLKQSYLKCVDEKLRRKSYKQLINSGKPNISSIPKPSTQVMFPMANKAEEKGEKQFQKQLPVVEKTSYNEPTATMTTLHNSMLAFSNEKQKDSQELQPEEQIHLSPPDNTNNELKAPIDANKTVTKLNPAYNEAAVAAKEKQERELLKKQQDEENRKFEVERLKERKKKIEDEASKQILGTLLKDVVHRLAVDTVKSAMNEANEKKVLVEDISEELYQAFIHEKLYLIYLETKAEACDMRGKKLRIFHIWKKKYEAKVKEKELLKKRKFELTKISKQLGVPSFKKSRIHLGTPTNGNNSSFLQLSDRKNNFTFSPIPNETNKFPCGEKKIGDLWEKVDIESIYLKVVNDLKKYEENIQLNILLYSKSWIFLPNKWILKKFGLITPTSHINIKKENVSINISCFNEGDNISQASFKFTVTGF